MGDLASLALRQFAAHRGLRPSVTDVCLWSAYTSTLARRTLDYALLRPLLQRIRKSGIDSGDQFYQVPPLHFNSENDFLLVGMKPMERLSYFFSWTR